MIGRKNRIQEHADTLKSELKTQYAEHGDIVIEFIKQTDPEREPQVWQKFKTFDELRAVFEVYLNPDQPQEDESPARKPLGVPSDLSKSLEKLFNSTPDTFEANLGEYKIAQTIAVGQLRRYLE